MGNGLGRHRCRCRADAQLLEIGVYCDTAGHKLAIETAQKFLALDGRNRLASPEAEAVQLGGVPLTGRQSDAHDAVGDVFAGNIILFAEWLLTGAFAVPYIKYGDAEPEFCGRGRGRGRPG